MKKMILALVAVMTMTAAQAQNDNKPERGNHRKMDKTEMVKKRTDDAVKKYGLNDEQGTKLLALNTKYADKMGPRMGGPRGGRRGGARPAPEGMDTNKRPEMTEEMKQQMETKRKEHMETMKQYDAELQTILTPDQYKQYKADAEKRMKEGGRRGGPRGAKQDN